MFRTGMSALTAAVIVLFTSAATAQYPVVSAQDVQSRMMGKKKAALVDTRSPEEYREGHISSAINIPAEQMKTRAGLLPKDRTTPVIFYCRGSG
jgi:phage shock protein E